MAAYNVIGEAFNPMIPGIRKGFAWHYKKYQHEQSSEDQRRYAEAENQARAGRLELWRENKPNPPWEYRRFHESQ